MAYAASSLMWAMSGRQFPGVCERTVRPCNTSCGCWGAGNLGWGGALYWGSIGGWWGGGYGVGPYWVNDYAQTWGCAPISEVRLSGYPVREILSVKIDGVDMPQINTDTGALNWRLDDRTTLVRMWAPGDGNPGTETPQWWPGCQNVALDDDQPGTFAVTYTWGADVPILGQMAAAQLARELWKALPANGGTCALPTKATKIVRQGITVERITPLATLLRTGATGLQFVDAFIAEVNPIGMIRRPLVWTPDDQQYARKAGQV